VNWLHTPLQHVPAGETHCIPSARHVVVDVVVLLVDVDVDVLEEDVVG
jgi:hypothetical protein